MFFVAAYLFCIIVNIQILNIMLKRMMYFAKDLYSRCPKY